MFVCCIVYFFYFCIWKIVSCKIHNSYSFSFSIFFHFFSPKLADNFRLLLYVVDCCCYSPKFFVACNLQKNGFLCRRLCYFFVHQSYYTYFCCKKGTLSLSECSSISQSDCNQYTQFFLGSYITCPAQIYKQIYTLAIFSCGWIDVVIRLEFQRSGAMCNIVLSISLETRPDVKSKKIHI